MVCLCVMSIHSSPLALKRASQLQSIQSLTIVKADIVQSRRAAADPPQKVSPFATAADPPQKVSPFTTAADPPQKVSPFQTIK